MPKFAISESIEIAAPMEKVYGVVADLQTWTRWSPWLMAEPDAKVEVTEGGAVYRWEGAIVGAGEIRQLEAMPSRSLYYTLTFLKPWKSKASVGFQFQETESGARATWTMDSSLPFFLFFMKAMMAAMVGSDFRRGLRMLKDFVETGAVPSRLSFEERKSYDGCEYIGIRTRCGIAEVGPRMEQDFRRLEDWLRENGTRQSGPPLALYHKFEVARGVVEYTAATPVEILPDPLPEGFVCDSLPGLDAYEVKHVGPYRHLGNAWAAGMMRARAKVFRMRKGAPPFELYENPPGETPESELVTSVRFPLR